MCAQEADCCYVQALHASHLGLIMGQLVNVLQTNGAPHVEAAGPEATEVSCRLRCMGMPMMRAWRSGAPRP